MSKTITTHIRVAEKYDINAFSNMAVSLNRLAGRCDYNNIQYGRFLFDKWHSIIAFVAEDKDGTIGGVLAEIVTDIWSGEKKAFVTILWCEKGVPLKTSHMLMKAMIETLKVGGIKKTIMFTSSMNPHKPFQKYGFTEEATYYEADTETVCAALTERGV